MERAAVAFCEAYIQNYPDKRLPIAVYCGTGNNGGDGLAIARLLHRSGYKIDVKIARFSGKSTSDFDGNLARLMSQGIRFDEFTDSSELRVETAPILIDALLGSGLNKPLEGKWLTLVEWLNSLGREVVSVDIPTGFKGEGIVSKHDVTVKSALTICFQRPKINFLLPESVFCIRRFEVVDIGLDEEFIQAATSPFLLLTDRDIDLRLKKRAQFSHKGTFGHALIIGGQLTTLGAALLATEACLSGGAGLTTACIPEEGLTALNVRLPEAMAVLRFQNRLPNDINWDRYNCLAIGPGLGVDDSSLEILSHTLKKFKRPMVIDADAINLLSLHRDLIPQIPKLSILTPHVKEFDRLFGHHSGWWERLETAMHQSQEMGVYIVLKNRYTIIATPDGRCVFNPTGTPAMATGGMGDVLTGLIASLLAQGCKPEDAALAGVFLHGKAGQDLVRVENRAVIRASKLAEYLPLVIAGFN
jgi:NAD(P)H-hydrate epimerase